MIESAKLAGLLQGPLVWLPATLAIYAAATACGAATARRRSSIPRC